MGVGAPSGTVTFLFTDIEGSTRLWQSEPEAMRKALQRHDAILRAAVDAHGGYVFSTGGDGFAVAFARSADAVDAAVAAQASLGIESWPEDAEIRVRMGMHTGEAEERDGDYFGTPVNQAARLMAVGHGGQVLCSAVTAGLVGAGVGVVDLGEHRLRDLSAAQRIFQVGDGRFPPLRSLDAVPGNLPTVLTELVGRSDDIARLVRLVGDERLVTLTGVGGIGKTRLALAAAAAAAPSFADGCWFAELAPAATADEVLGAVAAAMGAPATDRAGLARYVADRQVLIVLDNCEHVLSDAARLARALLGAGPEIVIVATSREPLGVDGEVVRGVASLDTPDDDEDVTVAVAAVSAAVRLFVARAQASSDRFRLDESNVAAVVAICRQLDGIPLAIELAAARVRAMPPAEISRRLGDRFRLLAGGRGAQERHRTLQATVSWSHDLLSDEERRVFRRLAVFPGSFDLETAERIADDGAVDVVDVVVRLVDRSLVQYDDASGRYRLLETLRQYAADRLGEAAETEATRDAHATFFCELVEQFAPALLDARWYDAVGRLLPDLDNLRAAAAWLAEAGRWGDLQDLGRRTFSLMVQFSPADGARWLRQSVDAVESPADQERVDAMGELAMVTLGVGEIDVAAGRADQSIRLADDRQLQASPWAWATKVLVGVWSNDPRGSVEAGRAGVASARRDDLAASMIESLAVPSLAALGDLDGSQAAADNSLTLALRTTHPVTIVSAVTSVAAARLYHRDPPDCTGALDILERNAHHHRLAEDSSSGLWLELMRGLALVGAQQDTAVSLLARCLRSADRLRIFPAAELAVRLLVLDTAATGQTETAAILLGYLDTNLAAFRTNASGLVWLDQRIDEGLGTLTADQRDLHCVRGAALTRRDLMSVVATLERTLTQST